jgi:hypothetical protein
MSIMMSREAEVGKRQLALFETRVPAMKGEQTAGWV